MAEPEYLDGLECEKCGGPLFDGDPEGQPVLVCDTHGPVAGRYANPYREALAQIIAVADRAHAEASWFCNKCGFMGQADEPGTHPNCPYLAGRYPAGWTIYNAIEPFRDLLASTPELPDDKEG